MAKKKSTTTSNQTYDQTSTSTPTVAPWLSNNYQGLGQQIADFSQTDPTKYVAGASDLQNKAFGQAGNLGGWQSLFGQAQTGAQGVMGAGANTAAPASAANVSGVQAASLLDGGGIGKYMNAGLNDLVSASLADYDYGAGRQQAAARAAATANKAFNNDRSVFKETELADALTRGRASTSGQLRYEAFDRAAQLAAQEAAMRQQAAMANAAAYNQASMFNAGQTNQANQFNAGQMDNSLARKLSAAGILGNLGSAMGDNSRADLASTLGAGQVQQGIQQSQLNATPTFLQMLAGLNSSIPIGAFTGQTTTGSGNQSGTSKTVVSDPMGTLTSLLSGAGSLASGFGALKFGA